MAEWGREGGWGGGEWGWRCPRKIRRPYLGHGNQAFNDYIIAFVSCFGYQFDPLVFSSRRPRRARDHCKSMKTPVSLWICLGPLFAPSAKRTNFRTPGHEKLRDKQVQKQPPQRAENDSKTFDLGSQHGSQNDPKLKCLKKTLKSKTMKLKTWPWN